MFLVSKLLLPQLYVFLCELPLKFDGLSVMQQLKYLRTVSRWFLSDKSFLHALCESVCFVHFIFGVFELCSGLLFEWHFVSSVFSLLRHVYSQQHLPQLPKRVFPQHLSHAESLCSMFIDFGGVCFLQFFDCLYRV